MHLKAVVEYDGSAYYGWQIQPDKKTVQGEIREALFKLFNKNIDIKYSSRTDRGVHAKGQVIVFESSLNLPPDRIQTALNSLLSRNIIINKLTECSPKFDPRYDVKSKTYTYRILNMKFNDYQLKDFVWHIPYKIDWKKIKKALKIIEGDHEFKLFSSPEPGKRTRLTIKKAGLKKCGSLYEMTFQARSFLTYMIRFLVGYTIGIGKGKESVENLRNMLVGKGRRCNRCAPACGLELSRIVFKGEK